MLLQGFLITNNGSVLRFKVKTTRKIEKYEEKIQLQVATSNLMTLCGIIMTIRKK